MPGLGNLPIGRTIETCGPLACGLLGLAMLVYFKQDVMQLSVDGKISITNLYNAIFDWTAIQTGCLFGIYGFVAGKTDGFIGEIRHTRSMRRYNVYIRRAMYIGFVLTIASIPLIVTNYKIDANDHKLYYIVAVWFSLFLWAFCSFARVAYIFGILIRVNENPRVPAG